MPPPVHFLGFFALVSTSSANRIDGNIEFKDEQGKLLCKTSQFCFDHRNDCGRISIKRKCGLSCCWENGTRALGPPEHPAVPPPPPALSPPPFHRNPACKAFFDASIKPPTMGSRKARFYDALATATTRPVRVRRVWAAIVFGFELPMLRLHMETLFSSVAGFLVTEADRCASRLSRPNSALPNSVLPNSVLPYPALPNPALTSPALPDPEAGQCSALSLRLALTASANAAC